MDGSNHHASEIKSYAAIDADASNVQNGIDVALVGLDKVSEALGSLKKQDHCLCQ